MRILADLHHFCLYHSLSLLFEKRLGHTLFRPIGMEWKNEGFWDVGKAPELAECLLSTKSGRCAEILSKYEVLPIDWAVFSLHLPRMGEILDVSSKLGEVELHNGFYWVWDKSKSVWQEAITLEAFKNTPFDIIISSIPQHFELFERLRQQYQPQAKHVLYVSGVNQVVPTWAKNVIVNSPRDLPRARGLNGVCIHQEFDLGTFGYAQPPPDAKVVHSYVHFPETEEFWRQVGLDWDFKFVGKTLGPIKDIVVKSSELAAKMAQSGFTLHIKPGGESAGHILFNSYAVGRPVVINKKDYIGTAGEALLTPETSFDVADGPVKLRKWLEHYSSPGRHRQICGRVRAQFERVVDFSADEQKIRTFVKELR